MKPVTVETLDPEEGTVPRNVKTPDDRTDEEADALNERRRNAEPTDMHHEFANWIKEQTGYTPDIETIKLSTMMRNDFRRSSRYKNFKAKKAEEAESENGDGGDSGGSSKSSGGGTKKKTSSSKKKKSSSSKQKAEDALDE